MRRTTLIRLAATSLTLLSTAGHAAPNRPLTVSEVQSFGRGLAHWMELRARCGEGSRFQGSRGVVRARLAAFRTAAATLRGLAPSGNDLLAARGLGNYNPLGLSEDFAETADGLEGSVGEPAAGSIALGRQIGAAAQSIQALIRELTARNEALAEADRGPGNLVLGRLRAALNAAYSASGAIACMRAEDEIDYVVVRTVLAAPPETEILPDTLGSRPLVVRGGSCATLDDVATNLHSIIQDTNEAILADRAYHERAVASQLSVEYVRRHGGREGRLSSTRETKLREMTNDLIARFIRYEERLAEREARRAARSGS